LRREFRENCKEKEEGNRKWIEEELKSITTEAQIWKFVNLGRKKARIIDENISMEEWERHFLELLEGERGTGEETGEKRRTEGDQKKELREEEIEIQLKKVKRKKATGVDDMAGEAWLYSNERIKERLKDLLKSIWKGEGFPEEWRKGVITPIHKKGDTNEVRNYRGITLLCTAYNIYAAILAERLSEEIERKASLLETQAGFRKGRGTIDNMRILQQVINKEISKKRGKCTVSS